MWRQTEHKKETNSVLHSRSFRSMLNQVSHAPGPQERLKSDKNREKIDKKAMLKTYSENDAKKLPKGCQKGGLRGAKMEVKSIPKRFKTEVDFQD